MIPMAIEEPSVVAAASDAAKMARVRREFEASSKSSVNDGPNTGCRFKRS
ncbi:hypothetical protein HRbin06_01024 [archaeon HR06]|nr:hypothetical protein HRbin06_01024 [archaeon HR06]